MSKEILAVLYKLKNWHGETFMINVTDSEEALDALIMEFKIRVEMIIPKQRDIKELINSFTKKEHDTLEQYFKEIFNDEGILNE